MSVKNMEDSHYGRINKFVETDKERSNYPFEQKIMQPYGMEAPLLLLNESWKLLTFSHTQKFHVVLVLGNEIVHQKNEEHGIDVALQDLSKLLLPGGLLVCDTRN